MRKYELVVIVKPSLSEPERGKLLDTIKSWLTDAKVTKEEDLGSKALAYRIGQDLTGHYFDLHVEAQGISADFERRLLDNDSVLRHLLLKVK